MSKMKKVIMEGKSKYNIKSGDTLININELTKAVNDYDKKFGIKIKKRDMWNEPLAYKNVLEAKCDMNIASLICIVNGIDCKEYFETDNSEFGYGTISKPISTYDAVFTDYSLLYWNYNKRYSVNSLMFRCRFLTLVMSQMLDRIDKITSNMCDNRFHYKHSKTEYQIVLTKNIMNHLITFINIMINPDNSYKNIILKMNEYLSYTKNKVNHEKLRNLLNNHIIETRKSMTKSPFNGEKFLSDDVCIFNTLKIAYMLATDRTDVDVLPKFKHIENATVKHDLSKLIEALGDEIIYSTKGKKYNPMFRAFVEASPSIYSQFYKEAKHNDSLRFGILALGFTSFVMNDYYVEKFIKKMLKKGK